MSMQPRRDDVGSKYGEGPSQSDGRTRNVLDATNAVEKMASLLLKALVNIQGERTPSGKKGCSFKEFDEHHFPLFKGHLNPKGAKNWLMNLERNNFVGSTP